MVNGDDQAERRAAVPAGPGREAVSAALELVSNGQVVNRRDERPPARPEQY